MYGVRSENKKEIVRVKRGEIWFINIPELKDDDKVKRSLQKGKRPFLITSNDICNDKSWVINGVILTSSMNKAKLPTHVELSKDIGLRYDSIASCEQPISLDKRVDLIYKICECPENKMKEIDKALKIQQQLLPQFDEEKIEEWLFYISEADKRYQRYKDDFFILSMLNTLLELKSYCSQYLIDYRQYFTNDLPLEVAV